MNLSFRAEYETITQEFKNLDFYPTEDFIANMESLIEDVKVEIDAYKP